MTVWDAFQPTGSAAGIARQLATGGPSHAWLLLGPSGAGKRATALAMAAALDCDVNPGVGCGHCRACTRIMRRQHPDVHHIAPEGPLIPVDVVRDQVNPEAARSPFEARYKVFVIEEADRMNIPAQNALLKTVEEPQPDTVFILVSQNEEEILETLRSRCTTVRLEPVAQERIEEMLRREGAAPEAARVAARACLGDLEKARAFAFDVSVADRRRVWGSLPSRLENPLAALDAAAEVAEEARAAVKERERAQREEVLELGEALGEGRGTATARNALAKRHRRELKRLEEEVLGEALTFLATFYRDVAARRAGARDALTNIDAKREIDLWAKADASDAALLAACERCLKARASFVSNANPALAIEATLVELTRLVPPSSPVAG